MESKGMLNWKDDYFHGKSKVIPTQCHVTPQEIAGLIKELFINHHCPLIRPYPGLISWGVVLGVSP